MGWKIKYNEQIGRNAEVITDNERLAFECQELDCRVHTLQQECCMLRDQIREQETALGHNRVELIVKNGDVRTRVEDAVAMHVRSLEDEKNQLYQQTARDKRLLEEYEKTVNLMSMQLNREEFGPIVDYKAYYQHYMEHMRRQGCEHHSAYIHMQYQLEDILNSEREHAERSSRVPSNGVNSFPVRQQPCDARAPLSGVGTSQTRQKPRDARAPHPSRSRSKQYNRSSRR